ncbi:hypothetical protein [Burkholderia multivorans]|uniref:hypothetical protein n=1 Tax=Burkholderia multivorans TaxID=87883 RepID=UPI001C27857C|nr:hypothetical protein [Burkholderia multivorans]MBU9526161.1 hypothetical protein [Burkholderia multivorans]
MTPLDEKLSEARPEKKRLNLDLSPQTIADLKAYAKSRGVTVSTLLRTLIDITIYPHESK